MIINLHFTAGNSNLEFDGVYTLESNTAVFRATMLFIATFFSADTLCVSKPIHIPKAIDGTKQNYAFFTALLHLSLQKTQNQYGPADVVVVDTELMQDRQLRLLDSHRIDVIWTITDVTREAQYSAVYEPLVNGLFGYRVLLINKNSGDAVTPTSTLEQIKKRIAVQGHDWPDSKILQGNGFNVVESDYQDAFRLLSRGYVDYFPRGITEVTEELDAHPDLMIAPQHVLYYPNLMYFFVSRKNERLAKRLELGLKAAKADGSYQQLINHTPFIQQAQALIKDRKIHILQSALSDKTQVVVKQLSIQ